MKKEKKNVFEVIFPNLLKLRNIYFINTVVNEDGFIGQTHTILFWLFTYFETSGSSTTALRDFNHFFFIIMTVLLARSSSS